MAEKCSSCGECAVMEEEFEGGRVQRICIECGTVASGVKVEQAENSSRGEIGGISCLNMKELVCESCGDSFHPGIDSDVKICPECQELEFGADEEQMMNKQLKTLESDVSRPMMNTQLKTQHESDVSQPTSSLRTCLSCCSINLGVEDCGADEHLVCKDCGTVAENEALTNDGFEAMSRSYRGSFLTLPKHAGQSRILKGKVAGHDKINFIYSKLCFPEVIREEAVEMFDRVFEKPQVLYTHITTKEHIAAACVFIVCRQHDMPVSLKHFRKYVEKFSIFLKGRKIVMKNLNISHPSLTMGSQVELVLINCRFNCSVISKVKDILFLCRKAWLTQGRSREGLIIIAAYYAFISGTGFITMKKFRQMFKFPNISTQLQSECNSLFLKLASSIPWVLTKNIKSTTVYKYLDDILKYQNSLLQFAFRSEDDDSNKTDSTDFKPEVKFEKTPKRKKPAAVDKDFLLPSVLKKRRQEVFLPETKISPMVNLDSPDVLASEFDEAEMASYLLSPEEAAVLRTPKLTYMHS
ncbi:hypothetical protein BsWGS_23992 [Bradybaena similaris]